MVKGNLLKYKAVKKEETVKELDDVEYIQSLEIISREVEDFGIGRVFIKHIKKLWQGVKVD